MGACTDWQGWIITDEQAEQISNGDINARNRFYMDNLARLRCSALAFIRLHPAQSWGVDDMLSSVYVDMSVWTYSAGHAIKSGAIITGLVRLSFRWARFGGYSYMCECNSKLRCEPYRPDGVISLDAPVKGARVRYQDNEHTSLIDFIPAPDCFQTLESSTAVDCLGIVGEFLSPRERDFVGYILDGFAPSVACEHLNIKQWGALSKRIHNKLVKNYAVIVERLALAGVDMCAFARTAPADYEKALSSLKTTSAQRERARENMRRLRERRKLLQAG